MKKLLSILSVVTIITLVACASKSADNNSTDNNTSDENNAAASSLTCSIDGSDFAAKQFFDEGSNKFKIVLTGIGVDKKQAVILFFDRAKTLAGAVFTNTFKMGEVAESSVTFRKYTNYEAFQFTDIGFGSSTITITKATANKIEGTFTATSKDHTITGGKFSIATALKW
jgi:hypothetical protein